MKLFGLKASLEGASRLARELGLELSAHEEREFEDGEFKIRPLESVRRERAVIYQSMAGRAGRSANDKLMRALVFAGALKDAGASEVVLVAPYLAYMRKDRRTKSRDPISTRYVAQMVEAVGVDEVITVDVHNPAAFENAFRCRTQTVEAAPDFVEHFRVLAASAERVVVVSPDAGGVKRARQFASLLGDASGRSVDLAFVEKHRSEGRVSGDLFAGEVEDATAIVIDDLISGGTTMRRAASLCLERGADSVHAAATHGVFAPEAAEGLKSGALASIVVTDTVCDVRERARALGAELVVLEIARRLALSLT
jgi:ribose-phosphate pyrophosphokinase